MGFFGCDDTQLSRLRAFLERFSCRFFFQDPEFRSQELQEFRS